MGGARGQTAENAGSADSIPIVKVEMPRRGCCAVSPLADGRVVSGETDREFAEWLTPMFQAG